MVDEDYWRGGMGNDEIGRQRSTHIHTYMYTVYREWELATDLIEGSSDAMYLANCTSGVCLHSQISQLPGAISTHFLFRISYLYAISLPPRLRRGSIIH